MDLEDLVLRIPKGAPLTPAEMDGDLEALRNGINAVASLLAAALNPDGSLKDPPLVYGASVVGTDAYAFTPSAGLGINSMAYFTGKFVLLLADVANAGVATLEIIGTGGGLGAKPVKKFFNQSLDDNDIKAGQLVMLSWDGTNWQMQSWPGVVQPVNYALDTGAGINNPTVAQIGTINTPAALYDGYKISVKIAITNNGDSALHLPNALSAPIRKNVATVLAAGDLTVGQIVDFIYDGTNFQMVSGIRNPFADLGAQAMPAGYAILSFAHTIGNYPSYVRVVLKCRVIDLNYAVGDEVEIYSLTYCNGSVDKFFPVNVNSGTNSVNVIFFDSNTPYLWSKTSQSFSPVTRASWNVKVYVNNG